jgi:protein gp37
MSDTTTIEWATASWSPWEGCTKVSAGCANCYAETRNHRFGMDNWGKGKPRRRTSAAYWKKPLAWEREKRESKDTCGIQRPRIFPSLCDWLDDEVPIEWLADFLRLIHDTPNLDWLLLTKRPENFEARMEQVWKKAASDAASGIAFDWLRGNLIPANVWLGASVENQRCADERIPQLLRIPAKLRFLSVEPMLEAVSFRPKCDTLAEKLHALTSGHACRPAMLDGIHWVIVGGESGPGARPCNVDWVRSIVRQCQSAGVPCFVKQLGRRPYIDAKAAPVAGPIDLDLTHAKGGNPAEWPADLQVRQFPTL